MLIERRRHMDRTLMKLLEEDDGVTAIEYALLASLIAMTCIAAFTFTGTSMAAMYTKWSAAVVAALAAAM